MHACMHYGFSIEIIYAKWFWIVVLAHDRFNAPTKYQADHRTATNTYTHKYTIFIQYFFGVLLFFLSKQISCRCTPILMSHCSLESIKVLLGGITYGHFSFAIGNMVFIYFGTWDKAIGTYFVTLITMCTIAKIITFNAYSKWINE